eukprot:SAG31_NODE_1570_length_7854_cov_2.292328_8_plen_109_part_00
MGFGNPNQGSNIMEMVFSPDPTTKNPVSILDLDLFSGTESERRRGGMLYGEAPLGGVRGGGGATSESSASLQAPDLTAFEKGKDCCFLDFYGTFPSESPIYTHREIPG